MKPLSMNTLEFPGAASTEVNEPQKVDGDGFGATLKSAIEKVDAMQTQADTEASRLAGGEGNLHETMLALEKADISMRVALKVRNKVLDAYNEVMRMAI